jgi:small subunit ribosomal protein S20
LSIDIHRHSDKFAALLRKENLIMPNTKSAARRVRSNERKHQHNRSVKSNLRRVEKDYRALLVTGKKTDAATALSGVHSTYDKAVKAGSITRATANRKKARLAHALNGVK